MGSTRVSVPSSVPVERPASPFLVGLINQAIDSGLPPAALPAGESRERHGLYLSPTFEAKVKRYLHGLGESVSPLPSRLSELAWAGWRKSAGKGGNTNAKSGKETRKKRGADPLAHLFSNRPEQARFHEVVRDGLSQNRIVLGEAATGVGKGRVIGALAAELGAKKGAAPVLAVAPTVQVLSQLLGEYEQITPRPEATFLLGRDQFVSERAVLDWVEDIESAGLSSDECLAVKNWAGQGAGQRAQSTRILHDHAPGLSWLAEDLEAISPKIPVDWLRLKAADHEEDGGQAAYLSLRKRARGDVPVVFATHSMLVLHQRILWPSPDKGIVPEYKTLLIDEAHLLAGIAEAAHTLSLSFQTLRAELKNESHWRAHGLTVKARKAIPIAEALSDRLRNKGKKNRILKADEIDTLRPELAALKEALAPLANPEATAGLTLGMAESHRLVSALLNGNVDSRVTYSPVRGNPSITAGPSSLRRFFEELWAATPRAALISATLSLPRKGQAPTFGLIRTSLHLPANRLLMPTPIAPEWLYSPTVVTPRTDDLSALSPPKETDYAGQRETFDHAVGGWLDKVAEKVEKAAEKTEGGMLVLMTSYETVDALAERLNKALGDRLITQKRQGFRSALAAYLDHPDRPVWLAAGPAWTGLDLSSREVDAVDDKRLTYLVIPRVPFGTERSSVHQVRMKTLQTAERDRAAFQFRQGLGRLVRRPGVPNQHLMVLDGRIWSNEKKWLFAPIRAMLERYPDLEKA